MHALIAAWLDRPDEALTLWRAAAERVMNTPGARAGFPAAWAGAAWQALIFGLAGLRSRMQSEFLHVDPQLPADWAALRFPFVWNRQPLQFTIDHERVSIKHDGTLPIQALIAGQPVTLTPETQQEFPLKQKR